MNTVKNEYKLMYKGNTIKYYLERKRVKNINLRIKRSGEIFVSANRYVKQEIIHKFVEKNADKIIDILTRYKDAIDVSLKKDLSTIHILGKIYSLVFEIDESNRQINYKFEQDKCIISINKPLNENKKQELIEVVLKQIAKRVFEEILDEAMLLFKNYNIQKPHLSIRKMRTRWGSCNYMRKKININLHLLQAPRSCIRYVIVHELCHLIYHNHSKAFYDLWRSLIDDWQKQDALLKKVVIL